jgi:hypothetical protein
MRVTDHVCYRQDLAGSDAFAGENRYGVSGAMR